MRRMGRGVGGQYLGGDRVGRLRVDERRVSGERIDVRLEWPTRARHCERHARVRARDVRLAGQHACSEELQPRVVDGVRASAPQNGSAPRSTFPPDSMTPIRSPFTRPESAAASETTPLGSTTSFTRSNIRRIASMMAGSSTVTISLT